MFSSLFIKIYILTWYEMFGLGLCALVLYWTLRRYHKTQWFWKPCLGLILLTWTAAVLYATVLNRAGGIESVWAAVPFHSYREVLSGGNPEILRSNLMNVVLFAPAGLLTGALLPARWSMKRRVLWAGCALLLFSLAIEQTQYHLAIGHAEIDDVLHNTLGAVMGCLASTADPGAFHMRRGT